MSRRAVRFADLGNVTYREAWDLQEAIFTKVVDRKTSNRKLPEDERIPTEDTLLFVEHPHVYTLGKSGDLDNLLADGERLKAINAEFFRTNRGGDITYHGPGQLVGYPIVSLAARKDLHAYLRFLEQVLINAVGSLGLTATRRPGLTGIWIGPRKVAALGVAVRRWITYHGFALNVNAHLPHFAGIVPCGIAATEGTVTSLHAELGHDLDLAAVQKIIAEEFQTLWPAFLASGEIPDQ